MYLKNLFLNANLLEKHRKDFVLKKKNCKKTLKISDKKSQTFDFATAADCSQLVNGPTHRAGGVLDLVLMNVPDLCEVHVHGNIGRSDHASLGVALNLSPTVAGFNVARTVPLKSRVNWNAVC